MHVPVGGVSHQSVCLFKSQAPNSLTISVQFHLHLSGHIPFQLYFRVFHSASADSCASNFCITDWWAVRAQCSVIDSAPVWLSRWSGLSDGEVTGSIPSGIMCQTVSKALNIYWSRWAGLAPLMAASVYEWVMEVLSTLSIVTARHDHTITAQVLRHKGNNNSDGAHNKTWKCCTWSKKNCKSWRAETSQVLSGDVFFFPGWQTGRSLQPEMLRAEEASQRSHSFNVSPEQGVYLCYRADQLLTVKEEDFYFGRLSGLNQCLKLRFWSNPADHDCK